MASDEFQRTPQPTVRDQPRARLRGCGDDVVRTDRVCAALRGIDVLLTLCDECAKSLQVIAVLCLASRLRRHGCRMDWTDANNAEADCCQTAMHETTNHAAEPCLTHLDGRTESIGLWCQRPNHPARGRTRSIVGRHRGLFHQPLHVIAFFANTLIVIEERKRDGIDR